MDGLACLDELRHRHPDVKVVMLSASTIAGADRGRAPPRRGAYLSKSVNPTTCPRRCVRCSRATSATARSDEDVEPSAKAFGLTERETADLAGARAGVSNDEIAKEFWVTQQTVKFHLTNIYRKLGVKNRTQATRIA